MSGLHRMHRAGQFWCGPSAPGERGTSKPEKVTCMACLARFDIATEKRTTSIRLLTNSRERLLSISRSALRDGQEGKVPKSDSPPIRTPSRGTR